MNTEGVNSRQVAFLTLKEIYAQGAYTDIALDRQLRKASGIERDRSLICELVYGCVRQRRSLDYLIDQLGKKTAAQQPPDLRIILHLGLYQLRYLDNIPASAAVNTSVELAKINSLKGLANVVNALLRKYERIRTTEDLFSLADEGILYSFPDWIIALWLEQLPKAEIEPLCRWFNQPAKIDLRVNLLQTTVAEVEESFNTLGLNVVRLPNLPQALRLTKPVGSVQDLPGYQEGWWMVQDSSAQLVSHLLDPQAGETIIDFCAAPGGKTTHIAELMGDRGQIWANDRSLKRLKKVQENAERLKLKSITIKENLDHATKADRVLVDAPCSGLGTLHKNPDIRWRQSPEAIKELAKMQLEILNEAASWVKPGGVMVYSTCTLCRLENEQVIESFLSNNTQWQIEPPADDSFALAFALSNGLIKVWPHREDMDGFFMVKLRKGF